MEIDTFGVLTLSTTLRFCFLLVLYLLHTFFFIEFLLFFLITVTNVFFLLSIINDYGLIQKVLFKIKKKSNVREKN